MERTPEQFAKYLRERFNRPTDAETHAIIITVWLIGVTQRLACLGAVSGGEMKEMDGLDQWDEIDRHRFTLIPPRVLGRCLVSFVEAAAQEELQEGLARLIAMYYTETGRQEIATYSFNRLFLNSP